MAAILGLVRTFYPEVALEFEHITKIALRSAPMIGFLAQIFTKVTPVEILTHF